MAFVALLLIAGFGLWLLNVYRRLGEVEGRLALQLSELTRRVWLLENLVVPVEETSVAKAPVEEPPQTIPEPVQESPRQLPVEAPAFAPLTPPAPESLPLSERLRQMVGNQEWEMLVGGSLLNKLGALVLVIGIALFVGYSFGHLTAAGRAAIALVVSLGLLGAGIWIEQLGQYRTFARGLIGAGWAALYATSYGLYAVPEARVIENPLAGSVGMVAVAIGMIWHSLRYRAQAVTAVAYFAAFSAMAVTPSSPFAVVSLIPLATSLLYLSARFGWHSMALFGIAATYLTCISRGQADASLVSTQSLFLTYWILFEAFDLLRFKRRLLAGGIDLLFPLNTACFLGLSYLAWSTHAPDRLWLASAFGAAIFLADSVARAVVRPPSTFEESADLVMRLRAGSFEGAFLVSAVLAGLAIVGRVPGVWISAGLAVEAEIVYLAGLRFESRFLRRLGGRAFALSLLRILWGYQLDSTTVIFGHATWNWTPPALFHALLFYANRAIRTPNSVFSSCATLIVALVLAAELPDAFVGSAWILFALLLFEVGFRKQLMEFRKQAYLLAAGGVVITGMQEDWRALAISLAAMYGCALRSRWMDEKNLAARERFRFAVGSSIGTAILAALLVWRTAPADYLGLAACILAVAALELGSNKLPAEMSVCFGPLALLATVLVIESHSDDFSKFPVAPVYVTYFGACLAAVATAVRLTLRPPEAMAERERTILRNTMSGLACAAGLAAVWLVVPDPAVTPLWTAIAVAILELRGSLRNLALAALAIVYIRVFAFDLDHAALSAVPFAIAGMYWTWRRLTGTVARLAFWAAILPVVFLIGHEAGARNASLGWIIVAIVLLSAGNLADLWDARWQSYIVASLAFITAMLFDINPPRVWISGLTVGGFYLAQFLAKSSAERRAPVLFSLLGTLLLSSMLYGRVSGGLLTVSWGLQGLALLGCGFAFRERLLRLQGLALLLVCILKLFLYDLRNLETIYRILSFVALGLILLGVSWIYTRFREHVRRLL